MSGPGGSLNSLDLPNLISKTIYNILANNSSNLLLCLLICQTQALYFAICNSTMFFFQKSEHILHAQNFQYRVAILLKIGQSMPCHALLIQPKGRAEIGKNAFSNFKFSGSNAGRAEGKMFDPRRTRKNNSLENLVIHQAPCRVIACFCFVFGAILAFLSCFVFGADVRTDGQTPYMKLMTPIGQGLVDQKASQKQNMGKD